MTIKIGRNRYYKHQKHWQRRRLLEKEAIWDGKNLSVVCGEQKIRRQTPVNWLYRYLHGGIDKLLERMPVHRKQRLTD